MGVPWRQDRPSRRDREETEVAVPAASATLPGPGDAALCPDTLAGPAAPDGVRIRSDLLPPSTWGSNIRGLVDKETWNRLRVPVCDAANNRCEICRAFSHNDHGRLQRPDCHEKWVFTATGGRYVQRLERLIALCRDCHRVQHSGRARTGGKEHLVVMQLCRVNGWSEAQAYADLDRSAEHCARLDRYAWDLDLSVLQGQLDLDGFPELYVPAAARARLGNSYYGPRT